MIPNIGFTFLFFAITISFFQIAIPCIKNIKIFAAKNLNLTKFQNNATLAVGISCAISMLCLIYSYIISDFSVENVYLNSHQLKPLIYKISGAWGNHEGSILLLVTILTFYSCAFAIFSKVDDKNKEKILTIQAFITFGLLSFVIFTSNPFVRIFPIPTDGLGLNPVLQDIGLAMHPPMLYTGYIGFSLIFSFAICGLLQERIDKNFAKFLRPWLTFSWSFLTLGIGLGSWWAYRELGWGGYWFWDAVENVSLMPWLCATALIHSIIILQKTENFKVWSAFLAILSFIFCLLGIFLVRSGILTSVHSFASDPNRGIFIIMLFLIIGGFGFGVFALKSLKIQQNDRHYDIFSKTGLILINNFIFCLSLFIVVLGTLYPIILQILDSDSISVGAPYYSKMLAPIVILILSLMIFIPSLNLENFKKFNKKTIKKLIFSAIYSIFLFLFLSKTSFQIIPFLAIFLGLMVISFAVLHFQNPKKNLKNALANYPMLISHIAFSLIILAICVNALFGQTIQKNIVFGDEISVNSYKIKFLKVDHGYKDNYLKRIGVFEINDGQKTFFLKPETRYYPVSDQNTSESAIKHNFFSDLYLVLGEKNTDNNFAVRIYYRPFISFIWLGCFMMFGAGMLFILSKIIQSTFSKNA